MKFKVDENLPREVVGLLSAGGHDAATVQDEGLAGAPDSRIGAVCQAEDRIFVTLDLDFADLRAYPPAEYPGFVVLRLRHHDKPHVLASVARLLEVFETERVAGRLWIVEEERIRIRGDGGEEAT